MVVCIPARASAAQVRQVRTYLSKMEMNLAANQEMIVVQENLSPLPFAFYVREGVVVECFVPVFPEIEVLGGEAFRWFIHADSQ